MKSRKDEMREQCVKFHRANPIVWEYFVRFSKMMIAKGFKNYSVNAVFERIRWEIDAGGDGVSAFKLNNNYRAFYARAFMKKYPEYDGFFRTRIQTTEEKPATDLPELTPEYFDRG